MKKHEDELLEDFAAFEELDQPLDAGEEHTLVQKTPPVSKAAKTKAEPQPALAEEPEPASNFDAFEFAPDVPIQVVAVLAKKTLSLKELFELRLGSVVDLGRPPSEYVDLVANGKMIGRGELVEIDGKLGVRIINLRTR